MVSDIKDRINLGISDVFIFNFYADIVIKMYILRTFWMSFKTCLNGFHLRSNVLDLLLIQI